MLRSIARRVGTLALLVALSVFASVTPAFADDTPLECTYLEGSNANGQSYQTWSKPAYSTLTRSGDGYMRVQGNVRDQGIVVAYYDGAFRLTSRRVLPAELPIYGGFYESDAHYYLVTGQKNLDELTDLEVFRVTKYDKDWNRIGSCSLYGANTYIPFDAGSCRMDMEGSRLVVRTCHEMFASSDGLHHQASVMMLVDTDAMEIVDSHTSVANNSVGYVSHSFNQFVRIVDGKVVAVDHGDARPRGICLLEYPKAITEAKAVSSSGVKATTVMSFEGSTGQNTTGASLGGFEVSDSSYLVVGNSVPQDASFSSYRTRNVFVASVDRATKAVTTTWLTSYAEGETTTTTPQMAPMGDGSYLVSWGHGDTVEYAFVDANGAALSAVRTLEGSLSDCAPLVEDEVVTWYSWENGAETFYQVSADSPDSPAKVETHYGHDYQWTGTTDGVVSFACSKCGATKTGVAPTAFSVYWRDAKSSDYYYYSGIPRGLERGDVLEYMTSNLQYPEGGDESYDDFVAELDDPEAATVAGESIAFHKAGTFKITMYPQYNPTLRKTYSVKIVKPLESVGLDATAAEPHYGDTIDLSATVDGGKGTLSYTFVAVAEDGTETTIQSSSTRSSCSWKPSAVGNYQLRVDVSDSVDYEGNTLSSAPVACTVLPAELAVRGGKRVEPVGSLTYGQRLSELAYANASFVAEGTSTLVSGSFAYDEPDAMLSAGEHEVGWSFAPDSANYAPATGTMTVQVEQATPEVTAVPQVAPVSYHPLRTLGDIALEGGAASVEGTWEWQDTSIVPDVPGGRYACRFVPADDANYRTVDAELSLRVDKATPHLAGVAASGLTYGQSLADATLTGVAQHGPDDTTPIEGSFAWADASQQPTVADSEATAYDLRFVPVDSQHYREVQTQTTLTVAKAPLPWVCPSAKMDVPYTVAALDNALLESAPDWTFDATDVGTELEVDVATPFVARYVGADADCFEQTELEVWITRSSCLHDGATERQGAAEPTCLEPGAAGDLVCLTCGQVIESSVPIAALGHAWDDGTVTDASTCSHQGMRRHACTRCGETYEEALPLDPSKHAHVATTPAVPATLERDGSTEARHCADCGTVLRESQVVPRVTGVELDAEDLVYTGEAQRPEPRVVAGATELTEGLDYDLDYTANVDAGTALVRVSGRGDYAFEKELTFEIAPQHATPTVTLSASSFVYNGKTRQPKVSVAAGTTKLEAGTDYDLAMPASTDAGNYTVHVTLRGNYVGEGSASYRIAKATPKIAVKKTKLTLAKGRTAAIGASIARGAGELAYKSSNTKAVTVDASGRMTAVAPGTATITISAPATNNYTKPAVQKVTVTVPKLAQPIVAKTKKPTVKASKLRRAKQSIARKAAFAKLQAKGKLSFAKLSGSSKLSISKAGVISVKKGTAKGTYTMQVKVSAAATKAYKAASTVVTCKVVVK